MIFRGVPPSSSLLGWLKYRSSNPFLPSSLLSELRNGDQGGTHASNLTSGPLRRRRSRVICSQFTSRPSLPLSLDSRAGRPASPPSHDDDNGIGKNKKPSLFSSHRDRLEVQHRRATERGGRDPSLDRFPTTPSAEREGGECRARASTRGDKSAF